MNSCSTKLRIIQTIHSISIPSSTVYGDPALHIYHLRHRAHDRQLPAHQGHLLDCNFITRLLYKIYTNTSSIYILIILHTLYCNFMIICVLSDVIIKTMNECRMLLL